jgi:hypothetical protein
LCASREFTNVDLFVAAVAVVVVVDVNFLQAFGCEGIMRRRGLCFCFIVFFHHGRGDRCDRTDGPLDLDTRVRVCVVRVTLLGARLCLCELRVRLSLLLEPVWLIAC